MPALHNFELHYLFVAYWMLSLQLNGKLLPKLNQFFMLTSNMLNQLFLWQLL